ncbi:hypothetical protein CSKR_106233 [Clonorchis sinensis]|uniref:Uncharacterized protein n=1 Tax=Clonorchis sinensis TaxID=79923 RepID=A0A3R7EU29_CLOSI|nr:hypothetical protein CSKR_106233 [Clonorchis sinensis]
MNLMTLRSDVCLDFPCLGLGDLALSQPSCFILAAWQLGTERMLQLNDFKSAVFKIVRNISVQNSATVKVSSFSLMCTHWWVDEYKCRLKGISIFLVSGRSVESELTVTFIRTISNVLYNNVLIVKIWESFSYGTFLVPNCRATRRKHEGWDTARLPKPRQGSREAEVEFEPRTFRSATSSVIVKKVNG